MAQWTRRVFGFLVLGVWLVGIGAAAADSPSVVIHLDNKAGTPARVLDSARAEVADVFQAAGLAISWMEGPAPADPNGSAGGHLYGIGGQLTRALDKLTQIRKLVNSGKITSLKELESNLTQLKVITDTITARITKIDNIRVTTTKTLTKTQQKRKVLSQQQLQQTVKRPSSPPRPSISFTPKIPVNPKKPFRIKLPISSYPVSNVSSQTYLVKIKKGGYDHLLGE